ncbi:MAG: hypothetical protein WBB46_09550 [Candidatus Deferrimicrobiaceae bacterium]|jgi:hypothetical protein
MRQRVTTVGIVMVVACAFVMFGQAHAKDEPYPVDLQSGETFDVCASGMVVCPARSPICDAPKIVTPVDLPGGLGFQGVAPGTTLCSAASAVGPRRVFRITVH